MLKLVSERADVRLLACVLALAPAAASAQVAPQFAGQPGSVFAAPAHGPLSETVLRSAAASADLSALSLARANVAAPSAAPAAAQPIQVAATAVPVTRTASPAPDARDLDCMAQAVYFESKGEPLAGQAAVAQVVLNRVRHPAFPKSVCGVVFQRAGHSCQFSWACHRPGAPSGGQWAQARAVAARVMAGEVIATIGYATHFNGVRARGFGSGLQRVAAIGGHAFYRFNGAKGSASMFAAPIRIAQAQMAAQSAAQPAAAPHAVYASLLPVSFPSRTDATKAFASASGAVQSASAAMQTASAAVKSVVVSATQSAAQTLAMQAHLIAPPKPDFVAAAVPTLEPEQAAAEAAKPDGTPAAS